MGLSSIFSPVHAKKTIEDASSALNVVAGKANITEESPSVIIGAYAITRFGVTRLTVGNVDCTDAQKLTPAEKALCEQQGKQ